MDWLFCGLFWEFNHFLSPLKILFHFLLYILRMGKKLVPVSPGYLNMSLALKPHEYSMKWPRGSSGSGSYRRV